MTAIRSLPAEAGWGTVACYRRSRAAYHAVVGVRERGDQFRRLARSAITDLLDQRRPFGRLALTHVLMTAGDAMFAVSLAGSISSRCRRVRPRTRSSSTCS